MRLRLAGLEEPGGSVGAEPSLDRIFLLRDGIRIGESALVMDRPTRVKMSATRTLIASICLLRTAAANADAAGNRHPAADGTGESNRFR